MENCIFCKIARGDIPSKKTYEDEKVLAFLDINPKATGHTLLIPKKHYRWFQDLPDDLYHELFAVVKEMVPQLKKEYGAEYIHLSIVGKDVPHTHVHLIPRKLDDHGQEI
jgi:histidine triad (HIT) family protein